MTLQSSGTISMNDINMELKSYTASTSTINLNDNQFRKMGAGTGTTSSADSSISLGDFYGDRSHVRISTASHTQTGSTTIIRCGYIKDFFGTGSHLGSLHSSAGRFIPSTGAWSNANEREVFACYTQHIYNSYNYNHKSFRFCLLGQVTSSNTFTGIREKLFSNQYYGQFTKPLADATFSSSTSGATRDFWTWYSISNLWTGSNTRYIHWY